MPSPARRLKHFSKNIFIYILLGLLRIVYFKRFRFNPDAPRILIFATTALGDSIWLTPLLPAIKQRYPNAFVGVVCGPLGKPVFENRDDIDILLSLKRPQSWSNFFRFPELRRYQFQAVIISHVSQRIMLPLAYMTGAEKRIAGHKSCKKLDSLMTLIDPTPLSSQHAVETKFILSKYLDIPRPEQPLLNLPLLPEELSSAKAYLHEQGPDVQCWVGMVPGASKVVKQWQPEKWAQLGQWLMDHHDVRVVIIGSPGERALCQSIANGIPGAINSAGELPLREVMGMISCLGLLITNDTGPMHVASALQIPILAFLGIQSRQGHLFPYNPGVKEYLAPIDDSGVDDGIGVHNITVAQAIETLKSMWPSIENGYYNNSLN